MQSLPPIPTPNASTVSSRKAAESPIIVVGPSTGAGLPAPVDGPTTIIGDSAALRDETVEAFGVGMGGKLCIHPNQLATVASVFATTLSERAWAQSVMSAFEENSGGVFVVNGEMVDAPLVARARRILET